MKEFDLVIIGGGVAGLVAASGAAQLGARVAIVEKSALGGDCLRYGCVPTKRLIRSAYVASLAKRAAEFGVECHPVKTDFGKVMEGVRKVQAEIGKKDSPERFRQMGVEVVFGDGRFKDPGSFEVDGEVLGARRFIISTGSSPVLPPIPGLRESGTLTNETALELPELPGSLIILGGGPIGIEFAQAFSRLGATVTIIEKSGGILPREDPEVSGALREMLEAEGIGINTSAEVKEVKRDGGKKLVIVSGPHGERSYLADEIMTAIGRAPNVEGLALERAGVQYDRKKGITTDETLRTTGKRIYACGDVAGRFAFTHTAEHESGVALSNSLFPFIRRKADYGAVPWVTYSDPELARAGLTEEEAGERYGKKDVRVYRKSFRGIDRAVIDGEAKGLIKVVCRTSGAILGAHILGPRAGELIHEYTLAMRKGMHIGEISRTIHVYPTVSEANKRAADEYYREKLFKGRLPKITSWLIRRF